MAFFLVKDREFQLGSEGKIYGDHTHRRLRRVPACIEPVKTPGNGALSARDCARLRMFVHNFWERNQQLTLDVVIGIVDAANGNNRDTVQVIDTAGGKVLERLNCFMNMYGLKLKITVKLSNFRYTQTTNTTNTATVDHVVSKETNLKQIQGHTGAQLNFSGFWNREYWGLSSACVYSGVISIACFLYSTDSIWDFLLPQNEREQETLINKEILEKIIDRDAVIFTKDGTFVPCHRAILSANSTALKEMLNEPEHRHSIVPTIFEWIDMPEKAAKALLAYMYLREDDLAQEDSEVAFEVMLASQLYQMPMLNDAIISILLTKPADWYSVEVVWKLIECTRSLPRGNELKMKIIKVLEDKIPIINESPIYSKECGDRPEDLSEICEYK